MKKFIAALVVGVMLIFAAPAGATDSDHNTVVWTMHGSSTPDHPFTETQTFHAFASDQSLIYVCDTWYQVDTYKPGHPFGTTVFTLSSPAEDAQWIKSWKFVYGGECETQAPEDGQDVVATSLCTVPADGTAVITTTTTSWTRTNKDSEKVYGEPVVTTKTVKDSGCNTPKAPKPHPVHHRVSYTG